MRGPNTRKTKSQNRKRKEKQTKQPASQPSLIQSSTTTAKKKKLLTALAAQKIRNETLHQAVLLRHPALEADHLDEDVLVVPLEVPDAAAEIVALLFEALDL